MGDLFWTDFVSLVLELYTLRCLLCDKVKVLEFLYNTISIAHSLGNTHKSDCTEIFVVISWLDVIELLFHVGKTIIVFMTYCSCLWVS